LNCLLRVEAAFQGTDGIFGRDNYIILADAKQSKVPIPTNILADAGRSFIAASAKDAGSWKNSSKFHGISSYVTSLTFDLLQTSTLAEDTRIKVHEIAGKPSPHFIFISLGGPIAQAGRSNFLENR